jgi:4-hydroxybenzoate-CoA ligase
MSGSDEWWLASDAGFGQSMPMPVFNLAAHVLACAAHRPDATALLVAGGRDGHVLERWTYAALDDAVRRTAGSLAALGLAEGDRVLLRIGNTPLFPLLFFGANAAGLVPIPTSAQLTAAEADLLLDDSGARLILGDGSGALPSARPGVIVLEGADVERLPSGPPAAFAATDAEAPAFQIYTSGTSGRPKGVVHAQRVILGRRPMTDGWYGLTADDRLLHAGAFNWTYTLGAGLMDPWVAGATAIVHLAEGERPPEIWPDLLEAVDATLFAAVPALYRRILKYAAIDRSRFPALRHGLTAGEALKASVHAEWTTRTGRPLYEALGMSEISTYVSSSPTVPTRPGSPGKPQPGRRVAVLSPETGEPLPPGAVGLLAVHRSDPGLMLGYHGRPDETAAAFRGDWFVTGDLARFDGDGYLWYQGRADDQMNAFGYRVAPEEVERAIAAHPDVAEVAVTETAAGEVSLITAFVVPHAWRQPTEAALSAHVAGLLADYKRPRRWVFVPELPRTPSGKVLRRALRDHGA